MDFFILFSKDDFAIKKNISQKAIFIIKLSSGILISLSNLIFGLIMDKYGFKLLMYIITSLEILISASLYFAVIHDYIYILFISLVLVCIGGTFSILAPEFIKIFGIYGPEVYGLTGICIGLANFIGPLLCKFFLKKEKNYLLIFLIGVVLSIIKLCILIYFKDETYINKSRTISCVDEDEKNINDDTI